MSKLLVNAANFICVTHSLQFMVTYGNAGYKASQKLLLDSKSDLM